MRPLILTLAALMAAPVSAQIVAYDGFEGGPLPNLAGWAGGTGWSTPWQDTGSSVLTSIGAAGLAYPGLATSPGAAVSPPCWLPDMTDYSRGFAPPAGSAMYVSCLFRADPGFSNWQILRFGTYPRQIDLGIPIGYYNYGFMLGDGLIVTSNTPAIQDRTTLLVLEILVEPATPRTIYNMYVDPTIGAPRPAFPSATYSRPIAIPLVGGVELRGEGGYTIDELRIGASWESVLPPAVRTCYANCDDSSAPPILNVIDFTCFMNRYAAGDSYANCDGSTVPPVLNVNDFTCFLNRYAAGCP
jgi:hypothetical protein